MYKTAIFSLIILLSFGAAIAADISVGTAVAAPGSSTTIDVTYAASGALTTGLQFDLHYNPSVLTIGVEVGASATAANKSLSTVDLQAGVKRVLIAGLNQNVFGDGVVVILNISVAAGATAATYPLTLSDLSATDGVGQNIPLSGSAGAVDVASFASSALYFVQGVNGEALGFLNKTRILLRNNGPDPDSGEITFLSGNGMVLGRFPWSLPGWGSLQYETSGTGPLQVGPIEVSSNNGGTSKLEGTEVFELLGSFVSVESTPIRSSHQVYVSVAPDVENTGVAIYNLNRSTAITMLLILVDGGGVERARTQLLLAAGQQTAVFVDNPLLFKNYLDSVQGNFDGTLNIHVQSGLEAAVIGLLQRKSNGALIAVAAGGLAYSN